MYWNSPNFQGFFSAIELIFEHQLVHLLKPKVRTIRKVTRKATVDDKNQANTVLDILDHIGEGFGHIMQCQCNVLWSLCLPVHIKIYSFLKVKKLRHGLII